MKTERSKDGEFSELIPAVNLQGLDAAILSKFDVFSVIREDRDGVMYRAEQKANGRKVALKILHPDYAISSKKILSIRHQNILRQIALMSLSSGRSCLVMEMPKGEALSDLLAREKTLDSQKSVDIISQALSAVGVIHRKSFVVGNITTTSLLLGKGRRGFDVQLTSVGVVHKAGALGDLSYCPPEQVVGGAGGNLDPTADIWSLGVILFESVFGTRPFGGKNPEQIKGNILLKDPIFPTDLSPEMERLKVVVSRALEKEPGQRYQNVSEILRDLRLVHAALKRSSERPAFSAKEYEKNKSRGAKPASKGLFDQPEKKATASSKRVAQGRSKKGTVQSAGTRSLGIAAKDEKKSAGPLPGVSVSGGGLFSTQPQSQEPGPNLFGDTSQILPQDLSEKPKKSSGAQWGSSTLKDKLGDITGEAERKARRRKGPAATQTQKKKKSDAPLFPAADSSAVEKKKADKSTPPPISLAVKVAEKKKSRSSTPPPPSPKRGEDGKGESLTKPPVRRDPTLENPLSQKSSKSDLLNKSQPLYIGPSGKVKASDPTLGYTTGETSVTGEIGKSLAGASASRKSAKKPAGTMWDKLLEKKTAEESPESTRGVAADSPQGKTEDTVIGQDSDVVVLGVEEVDLWEPHGSGESQVVEKQATSEPASGTVAAPAEEEISDMEIATEDLSIIEPLTLQGSSAAANISAEEESSAEMLASAEIVASVDLVDSAEVKAPTLDAPEEIPGVSDPSAEHRPADMGRERAGASTPPPETEEAASEESLPESVSEELVSENAAIEQIVPELAPSGSPESELQGAETFAAEPRKKLFAFIPAGISMIQARAGGAWTRVSSARRSLAQWRLGKTDKDVAAAIGTVAALETGNDRLKKKVKWGGALLLFLGIFGGGLMFLWPAEPETDRGVVEKPPASDSTPKPAEKNLRVVREKAPQPEPKIEMVTLSLEGVPDGSRVFVDGEETPRPVTIPRSDEKVEIIVLAEGYEPLAKMFLPTEDGTLSLSMKPKGSKGIKKQTDPPREQNAVSTKKHRVPPRSIRKKPRATAPSRVLPEPSQTETQKNLASNPFGD